MSIATLEKGIVAGLDRTGRRAKVQLQRSATAPVMIDAGLYSEDVWPLATVRLLRVSDADWEILGPIGRPEWIVDDHFLRVAAPDYGDTNWQGSFGGLSAIAQGGLELGTARLTPGAGANQYSTLAKDATALQQPAGRALWLSARFLINNDLANRVDALGIADTAVNLYGNFAGLQFAPGTSGPDWVFNSTKAAATTILDTGLAADTSAHWMDMVLLSNTWAGFWLDGIGPFYTAINIPDLFATPMTPNCSCTCLNNTQKHLHVDRYRLAAVDPAASPLGGDLWTGTAALA